MQQRLVKPGDTLYRAKIEHIGNRQRIVYETFYVVEVHAMHYQVQREDMTVSLKTKKIGSLTKAEAKTRLAMRIAKRKQQLLRQLEKIGIESRFLFKKEMVPIQLKRGYCQAQND